MAVDPNVKWPGWRVDRLLGTGSFGAVFEISRDIFGATERSALKVIPIPADKGEVEKLRSQGYDSASIARYFRDCVEGIAGEYAMMMRMKGHPNIVYCDDFRDVARGNEIGWDVYIKMELLTPLLQMLPPYYSESMTVHLGKGICNALVLCQQMNILHRDIKPENVFCSATGDFKLGDFGIAKIADRVAFGTRIGTYDYMAPEVYTGRPYGFAADQYALGVLLYWTMNNWRVPFLGDFDRIPTDSEREIACNRRVSGEPLPPPLHGSPELVRVVMRACAYDPAMRYPSAEAMLYDLQRIETAPFRMEAPPPQKPAWGGQFRPPSDTDL
jgi:serine/threonine protein kinase